MYMDIAGEQKERHFETSVTGDDGRDVHILGNASNYKKQTSLSSSTSSDGSSDEDFFQFNANDLNRVVAASSKVPSAQHDASAQLASESRLSSENKGIVFGFPAGSPLAPEVSINSAGSDINMLRPVKSPPVQLMTRSDVPDPNRIPASIFTTNTQVEWSVASNESLFSINVGNSSFSKDHAIFLERSGELGYPISPYTGFSPLNPDMRQGLAEPFRVEAVKTETRNVPARITAEEHADKNMPPSEPIVLSTSIPRQSNVSTASIRSFAFPILAGGGSKGSSIKVEPEPHQLEQPQTNSSTNTETPKETYPESRSRWFSCFSCCSSCN